MCSVQSFLSIFTQKYLRKCEDSYFILQNKYLHIYDDSLGAKILRDDCAIVQQVTYKIYLFLLDIPFSETFIYLFGPRKNTII